VSVCFVLISVLVLFKWFFSLFLFYFFFRKQNEGFDFLHVNEISFDVIFLVFFFVMIRTLHFDSTALY
jgi:hypothetical protein